MLNIPYHIVKKINDKQNILLMGIGGGFDVYGGLPIYHTLKKLGKNVHLGNYSFTKFEEITPNCEPVIINQNMIGANNLIKEDVPYYPEGYLAKYVSHVLNENVMVWTIKKIGVQPYVECIKLLIQHLKIDFVILIDGGVDSLNTGTEDGSGTILEDSISLAAFGQIDVEKIIMCVGFGTEVEERVCGYNVLRNMSELVLSNAFFGSCSLTKHMESYAFYKGACDYVFNLPLHSASHIQSRIIPAVEGAFENYHFIESDKNVEIFVSPFMSIMWFFDFQAVHDRNQVVSKIYNCNTFFEAVQAAVPMIKNINNFPRQPIPY